MVALRIVRALLLAAAVIATARTARADDRLALWHIVHDQCVADFTSSGDPAPCAAVSLAGGERRGYAVLKDRSGATQFLLIPTSRVTGIEDPAVLAPDAPNYFADAWRSIGDVAERAHVALPRDSLSLAINAVAGRSQDQLHIHMDCVRPDVRDALHRLAGGIGPAWAPLSEAIGGHLYLAMRIDGASLDAANPFRLLADGVAGAAGAMGRHTLVVVGMTFGNGAPGFALLDASSDPSHGDFGNGESLQDHDCAAAKGG
jgi:CDP-diacylglycerol pyrophosphatase